MQRQKRIDRDADAESVGEREVGGRHQNKYGNKT